MAEEEQVEGASVAPERPTERTTVNDEQLERRSIDPQMVIDGATAFGVATGGTGALLVGVAKVKETFGGGQEPVAPADTQPQQSKES